MAFGSYDELVTMSAKNPNKAQRYVNRAQKANQPVVNPDNKGYSKDTIKRRMMQQANQKKPKTNTSAGYTYSDHDYS